MCLIVLALTQILEEGLPDKFFLLEVTFYSSVSFVLDMMLIDKILTLSCYPLRFQILSPLC